MHALVFRYSLPKLALSKIAGAASPAGEYRRAFLAMHGRGRSGAVKQVVAFV